jgi:hypothetical protein
MKFRVLWDILPCSQTQNIPEDSELHTRRRENLKPHFAVNVCPSVRVRRERWYEHISIAFNNPIILKR